MNLRATYYGLVMLLFTVLCGCETDLVQEVIAPETPPLETLYFDISDLSGGAKDKAGLEPHVLGPERQNPLTVEKLVEAELAVKGTAAPRTASDYYIKFKPADADDLLELEEAGLFLLDFPWTREIIEQKDYYQSAKDSTDYPDLYTTLNVNASIPDVPYEVIAQLDLTEYDPVIIEKAFQLTGNGAEFAATYGGIDQQTDICLENTEVAFQLCNTGGGGGGNSLVTNECGCQVFANRRKPGGTIKVEDTQFNADLPVRRVRVIAKDNWFTRRETNTDDNGCWRINREFSGKAWFWVKFEDKVSDRVRLRFSGVRGWRFWQKAFTGSVYLGSKNGPVFNNIITRFGRWDGRNIGTKVHYAWAGATVNNAGHEFHDFAQTEGFLSPPNNLNLMVNMGETRGFTIMLRQMGSHNFIPAVSEGVGLWPANFTSFTLDDYYGRFFSDAMGTFDWPIQSPLLNTFMGDVNTGGNFIHSDLIKILAYHELGHASHFAGTSISYWQDVIAAEVGALGHGDAEVSFAGHIQAAESWAEHMALTMIKQKYPPSVPNTTVSGHWSFEHEVVRNERENHIPIGIFYDLIDGVNLSETVFDRDDVEQNASGQIIINGSNLVDRVSGGYTNAFFAQAMDATVTSPEQLRLKCLTSLPDDVTVSDVNSLFSEYNN